MKNFFLFLLAILVILLVIITFNTLRFKSKQIVQVGEKLVRPVDEQALKHLSAAIQIQTISHDDDEGIVMDSSAFDSLISFLEQTYPLSFEKLNDTIINQHSLLLHWSSGNANLKPVILYAHLDVVPVDSIHWSKAPFSGEITKDSVYGRGSIDDKGSVIAIMESVEKLLKSGFTPARDIYLAFGHDEEADGDAGAKQIVTYLSAKNVKAEFVLDEGGLVAVDMVPFVTPPVAIVFTSEKGYMTLNLIVKGKGGHSSRPPQEAPIEILSSAIRKVNEHPFDIRFTESVDDFMNYTGPEMRQPFKALFANRWLFGPVIESEYKKIPSAAAMLRTTSVTTVINGGSKENVIPTVVQAKMNFRLLPGDNSADVLEKVKKIINDERVEVTMEPNIEEASEVSSSDSPSFKILVSTINKVFPDAIVAPSLLIAQTDSRHFRKVTENIYRFLPVRMDDKTLDTMHGNNERVGVRDFMESIAFYETLIKSMNNEK